MQTPKFDRLTSLRAIAAWWVVLYHFREPLQAGLPAALFTLISHGFLAVDFFFILSGFIIAANYLEGMNRSGRSGVVNFIYRRLARIYPLHLTILFAYLSVPIAVWCCSSAGLGGDRFEVDYLIQSVFLIQNWGFSDRLDWNIPAWSISTEFAAYLVFSMLAASGLINTLRPVHAGMLISIFWLALVCIVSLLGHESIGAAVPDMGLMRCLAQFFMGVLLWVLLRRSAARSRRIGLICLAAAVGLAVLGLIVSAPDYLLVSPVTCLLVAACVLIPERPAQGLAWGPLVHLGEISYSTYLVHDLIKQWVKFLTLDVGPWTVAIYLLAVWLVSELCFRIVENPARDFLNRRFGRAERVAL